VPKSFIEASGIKGNLVAYFGVPSTQLLNKQLQVKISKPTQHQSSIAFEMQFSA
jgi:hypothetical protein